MPMMGVLISLDLCNHEPDCSKTADPVDGL